VRGKGILFLILLSFLTSGCASVLLSEKSRLMASGDYAKTESRLEGQIQDLATAKSRDLVWLCQSYSKSKKYDKLFACLESLERNIQKGDRESGATGFHFNFPADITVIPPLLKAEAYLELGNYEKAVELSRKAHDLSITMKWSFTDRYNEWDTRSKIRSLGMLALSYALNGDRDAALRYAKELEDVSLFSWTASPMFSGIPMSKEKMLALARVYMATGQFEKILENKQRFWEGLGILGEALSAYRIYAFVDLPKEFMMNKALFETGQIKEAREGYDRLLSNPETRTNGEIYWPMLFDRAAIYQKEGDMQKAISFYKQSVDVIEAQRSTIHTEAAKIGFVGDKQKVYHSLIDSLFSAGDYAPAFEYVERSKSRALVDLLASKKNFIVRKDSERQLVSALSDLEDLELGNRALNQDQSMERISQRTTRSIQIRERIAAGAPELASLVSVTAVSAGDIRKSIPPQETLVEYYTQGDALFVFVLTKDGVKAVKLDGSHVVEEIADFRKALQDLQSNRYLKLSQNLYRRLVKPVEPWLTEPRIIVVPHGALHYLPFNALHDGEKYLIEKKSIRCLPSASVLHYLPKDKAAKPGGILAFGNPDLGDPKSDLLFAQDEAVAVAKTRPRSRVLLRKDASETALRKLGEGFSYIHFATHGQFEADQPLRSALLLARDAENDGLLTVDKLYSLRLDADMVTLSACETGLGKIASGDDVVGLTRGFLYAGSRSIVASLWKVDDLATAQLMTLFYSRLKDMDKRDALRSAQLDSRSKHPHPYYWAAFQLTGSSD
jgi:CHAT domain-containing protein